MSGIDDEPLSPQEGRSAFAAEAALGLLTGAEAAEARRLIASEPAFADEVRGWHERFAAMALTLPEEPPSPSVRAQLNERLADRAAAGGRREDRARRRSPLAWIGGLAGAAVLAAGLWLVPPMLRPPSPLATAELVVAAPAPMRIETLLQPDGRTLVVTVKEGAMPADRDAELWWIADAQAVPVSIGVTPHAGSSRMILPDGLSYAPGVQLAISDEPLGGSPTGQATGPVLAVAPLTTL